MAGVQRIPLAKPRTRIVAAAGFAALLAAGPAVPGFAAPGTSAGIHGYAVATVRVSGVFPGGAAVDSATGMAYVPSDYAGIVSVIDESTGTVAHVISFGSNSTVATAVDATTDITERGKLPVGIRFTAKPGALGTALLGGTPSADSGGAYPFTISASNGVIPTATQAFVLTVDQRPAFTSPSRATFWARVRKTFTITTHGFPAARLAMSGRLPKGLRFTVHADGTATISGAPARIARGRTFRIVVTAANGVGPAVRQVLILRVRVKPYA